MVLMGVCGSALCCGNLYSSPDWRRGLPSPKPATRGASGTDLKCLNLLMGVSLRYDSGLAPPACSTSVINKNTFLITSGAALAVSITFREAMVRSFPVGKNNRWKEWCEEATIAHKEFIEDD